MASAKIDALPAPIPSTRPDRARHHRHAARFPRAGRLRRDARQRCLAAAPAIVPCRGAAGRRAAPGMLVIHTREGHRPDLADAPRAKVERGAPVHAHRRRRADGPHPDPRRGRPRHHPGALPARRRAGDRQARQGRLLRDRPRADAAATAASRPCWSAASPPRSACTPPCARPTTAAIAASCSATAAAPTFPEFHEVGLRMIKAQGGIFGWVARFGAALVATLARELRLTS